MSPKFPLIRPLRLFVIFQGLSQEASQIRYFSRPLIRPLKLLFFRVPLIRSLRLFVVFQGPSYQASQLICYFSGPLSSSKPLVQPWASAKLEGGRDRRVPWRLTLPCAGPRNTGVTMLVSNMVCCWGDKSFQSHFFHNYLLIPSTDCNFGEGGG